jgi:hypothetical protein
MNLQAVNFAKTLHHPTRSSLELLRTAKQYLAVSRLMILTWLNLSIVSLTVSALSMNVELMWLWKQADNAGEDEMRLFV